MSNSSARQTEDTQAAKAKPKAGQPAAQSQAVQRALNGPTSTEAAEIRTLQKSVGNRAVNRLVQGRPASRIQTKLTVGPAGDSYEQEADRVASQVMRMPDTAAAPELTDDAGAARRKHLSASVTPLAQRAPEQPAAAGFEAGPDIEGRLTASKGGGNPLPGGTRDYMEQSFGSDFGGVRVHTGGEAADLNRSMSAQAFTHGQDIYMGAGKYAPGTASGDHLLAHELTHVVQQTGTAQRRIQRLMTSQELKGEAGRSGFFAFIRNSTYTKIVKSLDKYHQAAEPGDKAAILGNLRQLIVKWLTANRTREDKHGKNSQGQKITDDARRAQLIVLLQQIGQEMSLVGGQGLTPEETGAAGGATDYMLGKATVKYRQEFEVGSESSRDNLKAGIFRGNEDVTLAMANYTRIVGLPYIKDVIEPALTDALSTPNIKATRAIDSKKQEEVEALGNDVRRTQQLYKDLVTNLFGSPEAAARVPPDLAQMVAKSFDAVFAVTGDAQTAYSALVNTLFLRFLGPFISMKQQPNGKAASTLVTLGAILQVQANRTRFHAENKAVFNDVVNEAAPGFARFIIEVYRLGGGQHVGNLRAHLPEEAPVDDEIIDEPTDTVEEEAPPQVEPEQMGGVSEMTGGLSIKDRMAKLREAGLQI